MESMKLVWEDALKSLDKLERVYGDAAHVGHLTLDEKLVFMRAQKEAQRARSTLRAQAYVFEDAIKQRLAIDVDEDQKPTWWCCSADYPDHEPDCPNSCESNP